jgi:hypothetical protein
VEVALLDQDASHLAFRLRRRHVERVCFAVTAFGRA